MIDINKKYRYRNGEPARVLCTDGSRNMFPVVSISKSGGLHVHTLEGGRVSYDQNYDHEYDLIEITLEVDDPVIVWDKGLSKKNRYFKEFNDDGKIVCFGGGATSFSNSTNYSCDKSWDNWGLPNE